MIRAIAIDDEPPALRVMTHFCKQVDFIDLQQTFTSTTEALRYLEENPVDLLFLDINMPALSGIEFYRSIPQQAMVIFTTAYAEYAVEGFNLNAIDYLLKPFSLDRFKQAAHKAANYQQVLTKATHTNHLYIRADYTLHKIFLEDIIFIEGLDDYLKIHLQHAKPIIARMTLKAILQKLPDSDFIRVHRSFIIPFHRIESVRNKIILLAGEEIPIGSSYETEFFRRFSG
ncbi:MAG: LytTR family DNA-binding domain-containing protein [Siphonobacter sp.]